MAIRTELATFFGEFTTLTERVEIKRYRTVAELSEFIDGCRSSLARINQLEYDSAVNGGLDPGEVVQFNRVRGMIFDLLTDVLGPQI